MQPSDSAAIESLISSFTQAMNDRDLEGFGAVFSEDVDFTNVFGRTAKGRDAVKQFHAPLFSPTQKPGMPSFANAKLTVLANRIRFVRPDVAVVDVKWQQTGAIAPNGEPWGTRIGLIAWIAVREDGNWLVAVMHNMDLPVSAS